MAGNKGIVSAQFYTFSAANRTITFTNDYAGLDLAEITYITNIKNGVATVIYDPFDATKGGTLSGLTLTLAYDTTLMTDTDPLQIITGFTPQNADPTPVRIVEGLDQIDDTALLQNISDNLDFLNLALDQNEGIQINTRDVNPAKRDANNAQVLSEGVEILKITIPPGVTYVSPIPIDTLGYGALTWTFPILSTWNISYISYANDPSSFNREQPVTNGGQQSLFYLLNSSGQIQGWTSVSSGGYTHVISPTFGRYVRLSISNSSAFSIVLVFTLKSSSCIPYIGSTNIATIGNNSAVITAAGPTAPGGASTTSGIPIGGPFSPTTNPSNSTSVLQTSVPFPIGIAGREQPYVGAQGGLFRYLTLDGGGRYILGGDTPDTETRTQSKLASGAIPGIPPRGVGARSNNMVGAQSLTVADTNQDFGDTQVMLLRQILTELKILNQQFTEMPQILNQANFILSDPQEFRNDTDFDSSI